MDNRKIFRFATWGLFIGWLLAVAFLFCVSVCGCSSARKSVAESHVKIISDSSFVEETEAYKEEMTEHSESTVSMEMDSVKVFPLRMSPEIDNPPDAAAKAKVYPAFAANLYGVRLNINNADSSSLMLASASGSSESSVSREFDAVGSEAVEKSSGESTSCTWGIIVFVFLILAVILWMRYLDR